MMQKFGRLLIAATLILIGVAAYKDMLPTPPLLRDVGPKLNQEDCEWDTAQTILTCKFNPGLELCADLRAEGAFNDPTAFCKRLVDNGYLYPNEEPKP